MVTNVLDQAQIADAINRQKVGSQRTKNEMMRQGTQDPGAFAMNNQQEIQQAQQPSEFWGAGRKELTAGTDQSLLGALGGTKANLGGQDFYYSPYDMSKASWGTQDADDINLGKGQYSIMSNGTNLGTGYKSLSDTLKDYQAGNRITGDTTRDWETLGQLLLSGNVTGNWSDSKALGGNNYADPIKGLKTLYGSKPILYDNKLLGYNQQGKINPITNEWNTQNTSTSGGGLFKSKKQTTEWDTGYAGMGRQYQDPNWWSKNTQADHINTGRYSITPEQAANSPGWKNVDVFSRNQGSETRKVGAPWYVPGAIGNELFGSTFHEDVGKIVDPILNFFTPTFGGSTRVGRATDALGNGGSFGDSYKAATADGWNGAARSLASQALSDLFSGVDVAGSAGVSNSAIVDGFSPTYSGVANSALSGAAGSAINGGSTNDILRSAAGGALGGLGGGFVSGATEGLGEIVSKMSGGAAQGGINSLFNKNSPIAGSLYGAMSGGLHGFLNSTNNSGDVFSNQKDKNNKMAAQQATSLAKTLVNMRKKNGSSTTNR